MSRAGPLLSSLQILTEGYAILYGPNVDNKLIGDIREARRKGIEVAKREAVRYQDFSIVKYEVIETIRVDVTATPVKP